MLVFSSLLSRCCRNYGSGLSPLAMWRILLIRPHELQANPHSRGNPSPAPGSS